MVNFCNLQKESWYIPHTRGQLSKDQCHHMSAVDVLLEPEQEELLRKLVDAHLNVAREERREFEYLPAATRVKTRPSLAEVEKIFERKHSFLFEGRTYASKDELPKNYDRNIVSHPGLPEGSVETATGDWEALESQDLLRFRTPNSFSVTNKALAHCGRLRPRPSGEAQGEMIKPVRLKILFLSANPLDQDRLALDHEIRSIKEKIRASEHRDLVEIISEWAVRPDDLLQALNEHRPHVVHFSGHGGTEEILLCDRDGNAQPVSRRALEALFQTIKDNIQVVVLNACYSQAQAEAITQHVPFAIGMKSAVGDDAAMVFSAALYRAIGFGRSVKEAFDQGVTALLLEGIPEEDVPQLLSRKGADPSEAVLVNPTGPARP